MFLMPFWVALSLTFLLLLALKMLFFILLPHKILLDFPLLDIIVSNSQCLKIFLLLTSFSLIIILFPIKKLPRVSFFLQFLLCHKFLIEIPFILPI